MKSYKILYQEDQHKNFSDYFKKENIDYIEGKINGSFAIQYNPQKLNSLLNEKEFFESNVFDNGVVLYAGSCDGSN